MPDAPIGHLAIDASLEYRMIGPRPDAAPTIVMLHEGLGSVTTWGDFPHKVAERTGAGVFVYSRAGYGKSSTITLPRPLDYMQREATEVLPRLLDAIGFRRGILFGHSDGATIAAWYAGSVQDHRVRGLVLMAPHFFMEASNIEAIQQTVASYETTDLRARLARHHADVDAAFRGWSGAWLDPGFAEVRYHRRARLHPRAGAGRAGRRRPLRHARAGARGRGGVLLPGRDARDGRRRPRAASGEAGGNARGGRGVRRPAFSAFTTKALKTLPDFSRCARLPATARYAL